MKRPFWLLCVLLALAACAGAPQANDLPATVGVAPTESAAATAAPTEAEPTAPATAAPATATAANPATATGTSTVSTRVPTPTFAPTLAAEALPAEVTGLASLLAAEYALPEAQVGVVQFERVDWPDACLGVSLSGEICAQVITPGYRVTLQTPLGPVETHTDESGENYRLVPPRADGSSGPAPALTWSREGGIAGICQRLTVGQNGVYLLAQCDEDGTLPRVGVLPAQAMQQIAGLVARYGHVEYTFLPPATSADMFTEGFTLFGAGSEDPDTFEEQQLFDLLATLLPFSLGGEAGGAAASALAGVDLTVLMGPACPGPVRLGTECPDQPYQARFTVLDSSGNVVTEFITDPEGRYRLVLPPGTYTLQPVTGGGPPTAPPTQVSVEVGQFTPLTITFDSGIR